MKPCEEGKCQESMLLRCVCAAVWGSNYKCAKHDFYLREKKRRKRKLIAIMRYIVALKNSDHVAHFISNKVFAHLIVNIWYSIQQSNTRPETFLIIILIIKPKIWCLRLEMLECCLQHLSVHTRVQWLQFESSNIKFSSRAGNVDIEKFGTCSNQRV